MANRKKAEQFIYQFLKEIDPSGYNTEAYEKVFAEMSDKHFDTYMRGLRDKTMYLVLFKPMYEAKGITTENNFKVAKKYGLVLHLDLEYGLDSFHVHLTYQKLQQPQYRCLT